MLIFLNKIHYPVRTLGFGRRIGIWVQGCSIRCQGCISRDTWKFQSSGGIEIEKLVNEISGWLAQADGVTISGGEPFDQPGALAELISHMRNISSGDILVFSGYPKTRLVREHSRILDMIDVLISEPFREKAGNKLMLRGSDNQIVSLLSNLARQRYPHDINDREWPPGKRVEAVFDGDNIWMAGIPSKGDMARLKESLMRAGFEGVLSSDEVHFAP